MGKINIIRVLFLLSTNLFSYNFIDKSSEEITVEYTGLRPESSSSAGQNIEKRSYGHLKKILAIAIENNHIANVAAIYYLARLYQEQNVECASITGVCGGAMLAITPVTFGMSAIAGVPSIALCAWNSVNAHQYRKLKRRAKAHLHLTVYSAMVAKIMALVHKPDASLARLKALLQEEGINVDTMIK